MREYNRHRERPEVLNRARLAQAARIILKDIPEHAVDFGWAEGLLMGTPNEDATVLGMIEFGRRLQELGEDLVYEEIERQSGMNVDVLYPLAKWDWERNKSGYLVSLEGTDLENITGSGMPIIKGRAVVRDFQGRDVFIPVGITQSGTVFAIPQK